MFFNKISRLVKKWVKLLVLYFLYVNKLNNKILKNKFETKIMDIEKKIEDICNLQKERNKMKAMNTKALQNYSRLFGSFKIAFCF